MVSSSLTQADILFTAGLNTNFWNTEATGSVDDAVKLDQSGLNIDKENTFFGSIFFEHPVPFIPNLKVTNTSLELSGKGTASFNFQDENFTGSTDTALDLSHTDLTLYWGLQIPVPYFDIDFGLTARVFDGGAEIQGLVNGVQTTESADFNAVFPLLYGRVEVGSLFGLYSYAELNYIGYADNTLSDAQIAVGYKLPIPIVDVNLEAGYRQINAKTDIDDFNADIKLKGPFSGLHLAFEF